MKRGLVVVLAVLALLLVSGSAPSAFADSVVAPNANTAANGGVVQFILFGEGVTPWTFQWEIAGSQLSSLTGQSINAIGFRLPGGSTTVTGPTSIGTFNLQLSSALNPIGSMSTTYANNIGADVTTVLSGGLTLGTLTGGTGPNPFFVINFTNPYSYTGGNLVLTLNIANTSSFGVDAVSVGGFVDSVAGVVGGPARAEFFNVPVTKLLTTPGTPTTTPEPSSLLLLGSGLVALCGMIRRKVATS